MIEKYLKKQGITLPICLKKKQWNKRIEIEVILKVCGMVPIRMIRKNDIVVFTEENCKSLGEMAVIIDPGHFMDNQGNIRKFNKYWMTRYGLTLRIGGF